MVIQVKLKEHSKSLLPPFFKVEELNSLEKLVSFGRQTIIELKSIYLFQVDTWPQNMHCMDISQ